MTVLICMIHTVRLFIVDFFIHRQYSVFFCVILDAALFKQTLAPPTILIGSQVFVRVGIDPETSVRAGGHRIRTKFHHDRILFRVSRKRKQSGVQAADQIHTGSLQIRESAGQDHNLRACRLHKSIRHTVKESVMIGLQYLQIAYLGVTLHDPGKIPVIVTHITG